MTGGEAFEFIKDRLPAGGKTGPQIFETAPQVI